jgi:hypothetical protein
MSYLSERSRISTVLPFGNKLIAGDAETGQLYQVGTDTYDEAGQPLVMEIIPPPVHTFPFGGILWGLHFNLVSGVGLNTTTAHNLDPVMMVAISKDGGDTFGADRHVALHRQGQTAKRIQPERRFGEYGQKGFTVRLRISASVQKVVMSLFGEVEQLTAA